MRQVVRCFLRNSEWKYLLVQHGIWSAWTLPGGHLEEWEGLHTALHREIMEEFNLQIKILWETSSFWKENITEKPLPLSIYEIEYESHKYWATKKQEYIFLAEVVSGDMKVQEEEIAWYKWFTKEEILEEESTFRQIKSIVWNLKA